MSVPVPYSLGAPIAQWTLQDWTTPAKTSKAATGGATQVAFDELESDEQWLIDRAVVSCTSTSTTSLRFYVGEPSPLNLLSGTESGNFDEAEYASGLLVPQMRGLIAVWSGCSDGAIGTVRVQARVMRRTR